jgi:hypothetical protein
MSCSMNIARTSDLSQEVALAGLRIFIPRRRNVAMVSTTKRGRLSSLSPQELPADSWEPDAL